MGRQRAQRVAREHQLAQLGHVLAIRSDRDSVFRQGLLSAVTNPKGLLFFTAFLPQFIDPARPLATQFVIMATVFVVIEVAVEWLLALMTIIGFLWYVLIVAVSGFFTMSTAVRTRPVIIA